MKKLLFSLAVFYTLSANAQNYLITFAGTGSSTTVNSVKVENMTTGMSLVLNGDDILHLTGTVGITSLDNARATEIKIYPNPLRVSSFIELYPPASGNAVISVFEITGKLVARIQNYLENSRQVFLLSGLNKGYYLIIVEGKTYRLAGKLLSTSITNGDISLKRIDGNLQIDKTELYNETKGSQSTVDMAYVPGIRLKFTGNSGRYTTIKTDIPSQDKTITFNFIACSDGDNNDYPIVEIGTQAWMAVNLKTTTYNNGDLIGTTTPATLDITNETDPKYQWAYNGDENSVSSYGRLYTWHASTDTRNVCPVGWYVPRNEDLILLTTFLGGESIAGGKLKEKGLAHWTSPNNGATDETGFAALPGGARNWDGTFSYLGGAGYWFTSSEYNVANSWYRGIFNNYFDIKGGYAGKKYGMSIRCLKATTPIVQTTPVTIFTTSTATIGGEVTFDGGAVVTERGVYWGTSEQPVSEGSKLPLGSGTGLFSIDQSGLNPNSTYYIIAYATNSIGTSYGETESFTTLPLTIPELTTSPVTGITTTSAVSGGNINYDGGTAITTRGVCWGTSPNPTISNNHTSDGPGTGIFISNLTGLTINTKYYVRAYATNNVGTNYGNEVFFSTRGAAGTVSDVDGNTYSTIQIGTQIWMAENLKTTKYNDNTRIPKVTDNTTWKNLTSPGYCWYNNDSLTYKPAYGALYNWFTVNTGKLCPTGWHVPKNDEFIAFVTYLGGLEMAGGKLKETGTTHWLSPNTGATNETGFTALPGGRRYYYDGSFMSRGQLGYYWSATEDEVIYGGVGILHYNSVEIEGDSYSKPNGMSVRCMKD
ncbi:MAG: T9SS type A sorting domain-containing protein [Bacteroidales bacterium]|nr:T9SS type A sorting domain-containing protein [Bacteroidales bacterium]